MYATAATPFIAALATAVYLAEACGKRADGPGSFQVYFLDELYKATAEEIAENPFEIEEV